jgi:hypothetical protein
MVQVAQKLQILTKPYQITARRVVFCIANQCLKSWQLVEFCLPAFKEVQKKRKNSKNLKSLFSWFLAVFFKFQFIERKPWGDPRSGGAGYKPGNFVHIERPVGRTPKGAIVGKVSCTRFLVLVTKPYQITAKYCFLAVGGCYSAPLDFLFFSVIFI